MMIEICECGNTMEPRHSTKALRVPDKQDAVCRACYQRHVNRPLVREMITELEEAGVDFNDTLPAPGF